MHELDNSIVALDLGSSLTKVVVGRALGNEEIEIIGVGTSPSTGIKNGGIVNIDTTIKSIVDAIGDAELMSGQEINQVIVNVTGKTIKADNSKGVVAITNKERTVSEEDVIRVIDAAQAIRIPADQQILHVLSKEFAVDDQTSIKDPIGMTGVRLEAEVHIVTVGNTTVHNLNRCLESAGLSEVDRVLSSLASSETVLTSGEKDLGTAVIDIGAGICDLIIYIEGGVAFSSIIPLGGYHVTSDISIGLKTPIDAAEIIKKRFGHTVIEEIDPTEKLDIPAISGRPARTILRQDLVRIIEPRMKEILELIDAEIVRSGKKSFLAGGVILTGGGSLLPGIEQLAEDVFGLSVGRARPAALSGLSERVSTPEFSTAIGLIKYASRLVSTEENRSTGQTEKGSWTKKIRRWMENNL